MITILTILSLYFFFLGLASIVGFSPLLYYKYIFMYWFSYSSLLYPRSVIIYRPKIVFADLQKRKMIFTCATFDLRAELLYTWFWNFCLVWAFITVIRLNFFIFFYIWLIMSYFFRVNEFSQVCAYILYVHSMNVNCVILYISTAELKELKKKRTLFRHLNAYPISTLIFNEESY